MVALKAHEVGRFLERPDVSAGIFLVYGPDAGLVRETGQRLARRFAGNDTAAMNLIVLDGDELDRDPGRLVTEAQSISLFGDRRVVRVRSAGKALATPLAAAKDELGDAAIVLEAGNLTPRDPLRAMVEGARNGRALPCFPDTDRQIAELIATTFDEAGIRIDADATATLREILGNDREVTRRELEKLTLYAAESKVLTREDIVTLCADNAALVLDAVADAAGSGNGGELEAALNRALAAAINPQQLLAGAVSHFSALRRWRIEVDAGGTPGGVLDNARPKPHFSRKSSLERQLRLWSDGSLAAAQAQLLAGMDESRKRYALSETVARRALLAVCMAAAER